MILARPLGSHVAFVADWRAALARASLVHVLRSTYDAR